MTLIYTVNGYWITIRPFARIILLKRSQKAVKQYSLLTGKGSSTLQIDIIFIKTSLMKLNELIKTLSAPLPVEWRVQSLSKTKDKAICTSFVDARTVQNRLDEVCAAFGATWDVDYKEVCGVVFAGITITIDAIKGPNGDYIQQHECSTRWDAGNRVEEKVEDRMYVQGGKSAASDAFKRAAVMFGLGRFVYDIPPVVLPADQYKNVLDDKGQKVYNLTEHINNLRSGKRQSKKTQTVAEGSPTSEASDSKSEQPALKKLIASTMTSMIKAIESGNYKAVEEALPKYSINLAQKTTLDNLIKIAKEKADANKPD